VLLVEEVVRGAESRAALAARDRLLLRRERDGVEQRLALSRIARAWLMRVAFGSCAVSSGAASLPSGVRTFASQS